MTNITIGNEIITAKAAMNLIYMIEHDAKEMAGVFHGQNRSEKFRINWPDEDEFVEAEWRSFVVAVRAMYAERLGDEKESPERKRKFYLAIMVERAYSEGLKQQGREADTRLQLAPNTQQFVGDKYENRKIAEKFGNRPNLRALFKRTAASIKIN